MKSMRALFIIGLSLCFVSGLAQAEEEGLFTSQSLTPETALVAASAALEKCRAEGFQVAVAVVNRMGILQVLIRDRYAGAHTPDTARGKAWTAVSFRGSTLELAELTKAGEPQAPARFVTNALMVGGGLAVRAAGSIVGGVGVSGAPGGVADDVCAKAGIESIIDKLEF